MLKFDGYVVIVVFFVFKQKTAYEMRISDWSSDVCSSDLFARHAQTGRLTPGPEARIAQAAGGVPPTGPRGRKPLALHRATAAVPRDSRHERLQIGRASCRARVCQYV